MDPMIVMQPDLAFEESLEKYFNLLQKRDILRPGMSFSNIMKLI